MADVLGEALQKLSVTRTPVPPASAPTEDPGCEAAVIAAPTCRTPAAETTSSDVTTETPESFSDLGMSFHLPPEATSVHTEAMVSCPMVLSVAIELTSTSADLPAVEPVSVALSPAVAESPAAPAFREAVDEPSLSAPESCQISEHTSTTSSQHSHPPLAIVQTAETTGPSADSGTSDSTVAATVTPATAIGETAIQDTDIAETADREPGIPSSVELKTSAPRTSRWENLMSVVSERRRQIAAVVVILCMAGIWFDESGKSPSDAQSADMLSEDFADVEAALSEFDVKAAPPLREPAEPVDSSTSPGFDLTIPGDHAFSATTSDSSNPSEVTAAYPDAFGNMEGTPATQSSGQSNAAGSASSGFSAAPVSAPAGGGRNVKARLSHSIQPIR